MNEIEDHIRAWIKNISQIRPELSNFSICPFSSKATYKVIKTSIDDIVPLSGYDVVIFVIEDHWDENNIQNWCEKYNKIHKNYIFLEDCAKYDTFINNIQTNNGKYNLILCQSREKLRHSREILVKSGYYEHWNDEMLKEILGADYELLNNEINT